MTFLFEDIFSGEIGRVNAYNLADALQKFDNYIDSADSSDSEIVHVYVQIF